MSVVVNGLFADGQAANQPVINTYFQMEFAADVEAASLREAVARTETSNGKPGSNEAEDSVWLTHVHT